MRTKSFPLILQLQDGADVPAHVAYSTMEAVKCLTIIATIINTLNSYFPEVTHSVPTTTLSQSSSTIALTRKGEGCVHSYTKRHCATCLAPSPLSFALIHLPLRYSWSRCEGGLFPASTPVSSFMSSFTGCSGLSAQ